MYIDNVEHYVGYGNFDEDEEWDFFDAEDEQHSSTSILPLLPEKLIEAINDYLTNKDMVQNYQNTRPLLSSESFDIDEWEDELDLDNIESIITNIVDDKGYYDNDNYDITIDIGYDIELSIDWEEEDDYEDVYYENLDIGNIIYEGIDWEYVDTLKSNDREKFIKYINLILSEHVSIFFNDTIDDAEY
jgi:hypothetical protein